MIHVDFSEGKTELKIVGDCGLLLKEIAFVVFEMNGQFNNSEGESKIEQILELVALEAAFLEKISMEMKNEDK